MKKLFYALSFLLFVSCSDNETNIEVIESDLLGTWSLTSLYSEIDTKTTYEGVSLTATSTLTGKDISSSFTFSENPNEYEASGSMTIVAEISNSFTSSQSYEYETESIDELESGQWELIGDDLIFTNNGEETTFEITSFKDNKMTLKQVIDGDYDVEIEDTNATIEGSVTLKFER